ncbi:MAG: 4Fe-4S binding protein, partial [Candidatus Thorarchaeota archaeon]
MQIYRLKINRNLCTGCNVCVVSCPINFDQLKTKSFLNEKNAVILVKNGIAFDV